MVSFGCLAFGYGLNKTALRTLKYNSPAYGLSQSARTSFPWVAFIPFLPGKILVIWLLRTAADTTINDAWPILGRRLLEFSGGLGERKAFVFTSRLRLCKNVRARLTLTPGQSELSLRGPFAWTFGATHPPSGGASPYEARLEANSCCGSL